MAGSRKFLADLVRTESFSGNEQGAAEVCLRRMKELGYAFATIDEVGNVVGANYDYRNDSHADVLLFSHLDTVSGFWNVTTDETGISGRGVVDAKGSLASYIEAGIHAPANLKVVVAGVTEEEAPTSAGIRHLLTYLKPKYAINGEPSNCSGITIAYKGRILVECRSEGAASHAGMNAENPIEKVIEYYESLRHHFPNHANAATGHAGEGHAGGQGSGTFDSVRFNVTCIEYGNRTALNTIPAHLDFFMDVRVPPKEDIGKIEHLFKSTAPHSLKVKIIESFPGCEISTNHPLVRAMVNAVRTTGLEPRYLRKSGSADMNITLASGIPTIAYGPGDSKLDHSDKEYLTWADYELAITALSKVLAESALIPLIRNEIRKETQ